MCTVSMIMDHYRDKWEPHVPAFPNTNPYPVYPLPTTPPTISPEEIEEFRKLLERAREYDKRNDEPECGLEEKKEFLRKMAKQLGVDLPEL